ncbi:rCG63370 [Rattus norvegicus]|uniref:RCG63370 n=1 Tax=Rattus norvegicus TaxID=10116 RepID=A6K5Q6_RAT|nr:rCG63370 [Rattus norvegicus]
MGEGPLRMLSPQGSRVLLESRLSRPVSSTPLWFLPQFLPPGSCPDFQDSEQ